QFRLAISALTTLISRSSATLASLSPWRVCGNVTSRPERKPPLPSSRPERKGVERPAVDLVFDSTEVRTNHGAPAAAGSFRRKRPAVFSLKLETRNSKLLPWTIFGPRGATPL